MTKSISEFDPNHYPLTPGKRLIEASAGTGKTFSLAHLVLRLITETEHKINEILVISFTKATASEIKSKISSRLMLALKGLENLDNDFIDQKADEVLKEWLKLNYKRPERIIKYKSLILSSLENIDNADITTIHGFCSRNIKREGLEIGCNINSSLISEKENKELMADIVDDYWREEILSLDPLDLKGLKDAGLSSKVILNCLYKIDSDPSINFEVGLHDINFNKGISEQFESCFFKYWTHFVNSWCKEGYELEEGLKSKCIKWKEMGIINTKPFSSKPRRNRFDETNEWLNQFIKDKTNKEKDSKRVVFYGDIRSHHLLRDYFHPIKICDVERRNNIDISPLIKPKLQNDIANIWDMPAQIVWQHALSYCLGKLKTIKSEIGVESFSDQIAALDPNSNELDENKRNLLLQKLRQRYKVILVDEFQDTDPIQWRIINQTFGHSENHLLLMVGDPKQSIYKFRGGDLETYLKAKMSVSRTDSLLTNYRASPELLEGLNALMRNGLVQSKLKVPRLNSSREKALYTTKASAPIDIINLQIKSSIDKTSNESLPSKIEIDSYIPLVVNNYIFDLMDNHAENISLDDICILVSSHDQAEQIRRRLANSNLPSKLVNQQDILNSKAASYIQIFLNCLAYPKECNNIKLLACSPLLQWNIEKFTNSTHNDELDKLVVKCISLSERLQEIGLIGCLFEVLESRNMANISLQGGLLGDLKQCAEIVEEAIHNQGMDAKKASRWLYQQRLDQNDIISENRRSNSDTEDQAIHIVTIHRSKGLEYKIVICPYLWQSPPLPKGPLWKKELSKRWFISLTTGWGENNSILKESIQQSIEEAERLAYVALTRARDKLVIIWSLTNNQENNPLRYILFNSNQKEYNLQELNERKMRDWTTLYNSNINIINMNEFKAERFWKNKSKKSLLHTGPIPERKLDEDWGRHSYSSWITKQKLKKGINESLNDEEIKDEVELIDNTTEGINNQFYKLEVKSNLYSQSPLANFPRGSKAGSCLHRILEQIDFQLPVNSKTTDLIISKELDQIGLDLQFKDNIKESLYRILNIPLGLHLSNTKFSKLGKNRCIKELKFDLSISDRGKSLNTREIRNAFTKAGVIIFGNQYNDSLKDLDISSKGFLTGSIDLVFTDNEDPNNARWWIADWKSNWIGKDTNDINASCCGPDFYTEDAMKAQMISHHYPLQAYLYLLALHRFLKWRIKDYKPEKHLGGYIYVFLRGLPNPEEILEVSKFQHPGLFIENNPIAIVLELDKLINRSNTN